MKRPLAQAQDNTPGQHRGFPPNQPLYNQSGMDEEKWQMKNQEKVYAEGKKNAKIIGVQTCHMAKDSKQLFQPTYCIACLVLID